MKYIFGTISGDVAALYRSLQKRTWYGRLIDYDLPARINSYAAEAAFKISGGSTLHLDIIAIKGSLNSIQNEFYGKILYRDAEAFISFSRKTIYINTELASKFIIKHEISHGLFQNILGVKRVPSGLHEAVANYGTT